MKARVARKSYRVYFPEELILARNRYLRKNREQLIEDEELTASEINHMLAERTDDIAFDFPVSEFSSSSLERAFWQSSIIPFMCEWLSECENPAEMQKQLLIYEVSTFPNGKFTKELAKQQDLVNMTWGGSGIGSEK